MSAFVIIGAGGLGRVLAEWAVQTWGQAEPRLLGFLDSDEGLHGTSIDGLKVLGGLEWLRQRPEVGFLLGVGNPLARARISAELVMVRPAPPLIHRAAIVSRNASIGEGSVIGPLAIVERGAYVGHNVFVNKATIVSHDSFVGDCCHLAPSVNLSGGAKVGKATDVGTKAAVIQNVRIGSNCIIGAGAVVIRDVPDRSVAVGVPARVIKAVEER